MYSDPIADMLTRIRNAISNESPSVQIPASKLKASIADVLQREGFIWDWKLEGDGPGRTLRLNLKYGPNGERVLSHLSRVSRPGCRSYKQSADIKRIRSGTGILILTTSVGVISSKEAREKRVGGEVIAEVW